MTRKVALRICSFSVFIIASTIASGYAQSPVCRAVDSTNATDVAKFEQFRNEANTNGGYVFAFRHANKYTPFGDGKGLTEAGIAAAMTAHCKLFGAITQTNGSRVLEMRYQKKPRVKITRVLVMEGDGDSNHCPSQSNHNRHTSSQYNVEYFDGSDVFLKTRRNFSNSNNKNTFVFANSTVLNGVGTNIGLLEGVIFKASEPPGSSNAVCFRFNPIDWS